MKFAVYQINTDRDTERVKNRCHVHTMLKVGKINMDIYDKVYEGEIEKVRAKEGDELTLERIFTMFNTNKRPSDFKGESLCVSDVVELDGVRWFCDTIGWKRIA